ncbi:unnamed protein product [Alternaria burnsii]|nr:unnamed protein product [Alternaria burnsii]
MLPPLTFDDKAALAELLRRRTEYISAGIKPHITLSLDTILEPSAQHQFFPHQSMILAYFCSSVEVHLNFSKHHRQTRTRLLANLAARLNNNDTPLQAAYTLACMEYDRHATLGPQFDPANLTKHMLRFAWHFKQHPEHFIVLGQKRTDALKVNTTQYLAQVRNSPHWDKTRLDTQALFDFSFKGGLEDINLAAAKGKKKLGVREGTRRVQVQPLMNRLHRGNALLQGLVAAMPGVRDIGSHVEVFDIGDSSDFKVMNLEEPDQSYEDEVDEMTARDDDAMEVDEDLCIIDSADLNLWISKRDGPDL